MKAVGRVAVVLMALILVASCSGGGEDAGTTTGVSPSTTVTISQEPTIPTTSPPTPDATLSVRSSRGYTYEAELHDFDAVAHEDDPGFATIGFNGSLDVTNVTDQTSPEASFAVRALYFIDDLTFVNGKTPLGHLLLSKSMFDCSVPIGHGRATVAGIDFCFVTLNVTGSESIDQGASVRFEFAGASVPFAVRDSDLTEAVAFVGRPAYLQLVVYEAPGNEAKGDPVKYGEPPVKSTVLVDKSGFRDNNNNCRSDAYSFGGSTGDRIRAELIEDGNGDSGLTLTLPNGKKEDLEFGDADLVLRQTGTYSISAYLGFVCSSGVNFRVLVTKLEGSSPSARAS